MRVAVSGTSGAPSLDLLLALPPPGLDLSPVSLPLPRWVSPLKKATGAPAKGGLAVRRDEAACSRGADAILAAAPASAAGPRVHTDVFAQDGLSCGPASADRRQGSRARWWTKAEVPLLCPVTGFPVEMLPYPPFRFRMDPRRATPHRLVDGKSLALQLIVTGRFNACGRDLDYSDVEALDDYICRCKLGSYRPGKALALAREAVSCEATLMERAQARLALERLTTAAWAELEKLRRIQQSRLAQLPHRAAGEGSRCRVPLSAHLFGQEASEAPAPRPQEPRQLAHSGAHAESTTTVDSDSESSGSIADLL